MSSLTFTTIQTQLHWEDKQRNLSMLADKINSIKEHTEIVVLPEMFSTGFSMKPEELAETMDGAAFHWMKDLAASKKIILTGSVIIQEGDKFYNRLIWMLPNGAYGHYDKRHLFAFAQEHRHYSRGNKRLIASVKGWKINLQVCYDLRFPVWARQAQVVQTENGLAPEYDVIIYIANWPERRNLAWKTLLQARAIENQCYVIGVNRIGNDGNDIYHSGDSMVINAMGEILYHKAYDEDIFTITLQKDALDSIRDKFRFLHDADKFIIADE